MKNVTKLNENKMWIAYLVLKSNVSKMNGIFKQETTRQNEAIQCIRYSVYKNDYGQHVQMRY